jgi:DNA polymerase-4
MICQKTSDRAKGHDIAGRVVTLKLKGKDFKSITRRRTAAQPVQLADTIFKTLEPLLEAEATGRKFRLIGAGISDLTAPVGDAGDLLDPAALRRGQAERASDKAREKFGKDAVMTGRQLRAVKSKAARITKPES